MNNSSNNRFLRISEVSKITSLGKSTICLWVAQGRFPPPIKLSQTVKVWRELELIGWLESCGAVGISNTEKIHAE